MVRTPVTEGHQLKTAHTVPRQKHIPSNFITTSRMGVNKLGFFCMVVVLTKEYDSIRH